MVWSWGGLFDTRPSADPLGELTGIEHRISLSESRAEAFCTQCAALQHGAFTPEEFAGHKLGLAEAWELQEEELLRLCRDVSCVCSATTTATGKPGPDPDGVVGISRSLTARIEGLLEKGTAAVGQLSAARWALPPVAPPKMFQSDAWIQEVAALEQGESQCRFEYDRAESLARSALQNRAASERQGVAFLTTGGGSYAAAYPLQGHAGSSTSATEDPTALPPHWGSQKPCWESHDVRLVDVTESMHCAVSALFEGAGGIVRIERVESMRQWSDFATRREAVRQDRGALRQGPRVVVETDLMMNPAAPFPEALSEETQEKWLLLPCRSEADVTSILEGGVGSVRRLNGLFGAGLYFVESVAQASAALGGATPHVILARVVLGCPAVMDAPSPSLLAPPAGSHSVVANSKSLAPGLQPPASPSAWLQDHREFVLHVSTAVYPAYVVQYKKTPPSLAFRVSYQ
eukprot:TRINITY_DN20469_c0_g1_i1.p1 TRINITY_DN20469_c0_g1~~TRINITY_DN20469_c0_g1_i1.p1  ORF type:complete len:461 (+),score=120.53 TRINITY_DN20469_c0_g1_i1:43-1425(+)